QRQSDRQRAIGRPHQLERSPAVAEDAEVVPPADRVQRWLLLAGLVRVDRGHLLLVGATTTASSPPATGAAATTSPASAATTPSATTVGGWSLDRGRGHGATVVPGRGFAYSLAS